MHVDHAEQPIGCARCPVENCPGSAIPQAGPRGWRLAGAAAGLFLMPIALAVLGAALVGEGQSEQFGGALLGLVLGLTIAAVVGKLLRPQISRTGD